MFFLDILPTLVEWDKWLLLKVNTDWSNGFLDILFPYWRSRTVWIPLYALITGLVLYKYRQSGFFMLAAIGVTMVVANLLSSELIKPLVERLRPCNDPTMQSLIDMKDFYFRMGEGVAVADYQMPCSSGYSFTSSHATNHFALSVCLGWFIPFLASRGWRIVLMLWAASIAYAQVYVAVHYPIDVSVGAILGTLTGFGMLKIYQWAQQKYPIMQPTPLA